MRIPLLLLLMLSLSMATCQGQISFNVPAVVGNNGGLVNVTIGQVPGPGNTYVTVYPRTGVTTQDSIDQAVSYAYYVAGRQQDCDILVDFGGKSTDYIDGPSAGTAMTVMTFALLENRTLRNDTIITGTIQPDGTVGPVGGLYEKATSAAQNGAKYFIYPVDDIYEVLLLRNVERQTGITVLQASNLSQVIGFMLDNLSISQDNSIAENRPIPNPAQYDTSGMEGFAPVAQQMIQNENSTILSLTGNDNDTIAVENFFNNEVNRQQAIYSRGYFFSAANEAFLNYIDLSTIKAIFSGSPDLPGVRGQVGICLTSISRPSLTDRNFQWVIGSDQRASWAWDKYNNANLSAQQLEDEKYASYNDLMYGQAWCNVAKSLIAASPSGGKQLDESAWKNLAQGYLNQATSINTTSQDTASRVTIAQNEFNKGLYGATIYDSVYVISTEDSANAGNDTNDPVLYQVRTSLWGKIYQSHASFLLSQNQTASAIQTAMFAAALDQATAEMVASGQYMNSTGTPISSPMVAPVNIVLYAAAGAAFLLIIALILLLGKNNGNNGQGSSKAYRAKQKKG